MTLRLANLRHVGSDRCAAEFEDDRGATTPVEFRLVRSGQVIAAAPEPDVFALNEMEAEDIRRVVRAVVAFCLAAQREARPE